MWVKRITAASIVLAVILTATVAAAFGGPASGDATKPICSTCADPNMPSGPKNPASIPSVAQMAMENMTMRVARGTAPLQPNPPLKPVEYIVDENGDVLLHFFKATDQASDRFELRWNGDYLGELLIENPPEGTRYTVDVDVKITADGQWEFNDPVYTHLKVYVGGGRYQFENPDAYAPSALSAWCPSRQILKHADGTLECLP